MKLRTSLLAAAAFVSMSASAFAMPISAGSSINLNGYVQASGGVTLSSATSLDFTNGAGGTTGQLSSYNTGTGAFAGITCSTGCGTIQNISDLSVGAQTIGNFLSLTGGSNTSPINFSLSGITSINRSSPMFLSFVATGMITYDGYDATPGQFLFSAQGNQITSFSGTTLAANAVPEPASMAILGASLAAVGFLRRRKNADAAA